MKYFILSSLFVLTACVAPKFTETAQEIRIELNGAKEAYCKLSTDDNRYALRAPGEILVEKGRQFLKVDCQDMASSRRRVMEIIPKSNVMHQLYPDVITVNFADLDTGNRFNGFSVPNENTAIIVSAPILTEDSFSEKVEAPQTYPVQKKYVMGRRSYPVDVTPRAQVPLNQHDVLMPILDSQSMVHDPDSSVTVYPVR